jgi:hypothetical protein
MLDHRRARRFTLAIGLTIAGVAYAAGADKDGDGVPNSVDACPTVAEDMDGFRDRDGCPDRDNDADGVPDVSDSCPDAPGRGGVACPDYTSPAATLVATPSGARSRPAAVNGLRKAERPSTPTPAASPSPSASPSTPTAEPTPSAEVTDTGW